MQNRTQSEARRLLVALSIVFILGTVGTVTGTQDVPALAPAISGTVDLIGRTGGAIRTVDVQGRYAYVGVGHQLAILDTIDHQHPVLIGLSAALPAAVEDLTVAGSHVYLATGAAGLRIFDVSDPADPREVGALGTPGPAVGIAVGGGFVYLAATTAGLRVVNVSNPANPIEVGFLATAGPARAVAVAGGYAYVAAGPAGLRVVSVTDPANPHETGAVVPPGTAEGVAISGDYAYLAAGLAGLRIIDVSNPSQPRGVGVSKHKPYEDARDVSVAGTRAYVADVGIFDDDYKRPGGLRIVNVTNPTSPSEVDLIVGPNATTVALTDGFAFVAHFTGDFRTSSLRIVDLVGPPKRHVVGSFVPPMYLSSITASDGFIYGVDGDLHLIDVSDLERPRPTGKSSLPKLPRDVATNDGYAYVGLGPDGLRIFDVSDPAQPRRITQLSEDAWDVVVAGPYAYVSRGFGGLRIFDVTKPAAPKLVGSFAGQWSVSDMVVAGNNLFIVTYAGNNSGLLVLDLSNPVQPREVGFLLVANTPRHVAVGGNYAYVSSGIGQGDLTIVNVADPSHPFAAGVLHLARFPSGLALQGSYVYVTFPVLPGGGLRVIDVSNPTSPHEVGSYVMNTEFALSVAALGGTSVGVGTSDDVLILQFNPSGAAGQSLYGCAK